MCSIFTYIMSRVTHSEPGLPMSKYASLLCSPADACMLVMACVDCARTCSKKSLSSFLKVSAKRTQHVNATYRNNVGYNMVRAFGHSVAMCCNMLGVVGSSLKLVKFEPTTPNMSQQGGQTHVTCCAQQCCDMLR